MNCFARKLPTILIAGNEYIVDIRLDQLRPVDTSFPWHFIYFDDLIDYEDENGNDVYHLLYDTLNKQPYQGEVSSPEDLPPHVVQVILPSLREMDPVGMDCGFGTSS